MNLNLKSFKEALPQGDKMKNLFYFLLILPCLFGVEVLAQVAPSPSPAPVVGPQAPQWLIDLFSHYPKLSVVLVIIGILRVVLKPTFAYLHTLFQGLGLVAWDQKESAIEVSKPMKAIFFVIDLFASVKVPVKQDQDPKV